MKPFSRRRSPLLALLAGAVLALAPLPALAAADGGVDFRDQEYTLKASSRTGHAEYTAKDYKAALEALPKDQQIAVRSIMGKLDATTKQQLEALITNSRVGYKDATGHTLLDNLWGLVDKKPLHGIKAAELITEIIRDVGRPSTIAQANHGTCTVTSIQSALARSAPGEYVRILAGLATGDGKVTCRDGSTVLSSKLYLPYKDRTVTGNLFQPAAMDAQVQKCKQWPGYRYDNKIDKNYKPGDKAAKTYGGGHVDDVSQLQTAILVGDFEAIIVEEGKPATKKIVKILAAATTKSPVLVGLNTKGGGGHEVQVVGWDKAKKAYKIRNPWGETVFIPKKDVEGHLNGVNHRVE